MREQGVLLQLQKRDCIPLGSTMQACEIIQEAKSPYRLLPWCILHACTRHTCHP